jgi:hypothetical protein
VHKAGTATNKPLKAFCVLPPLSVTNQPPKYFHGFFHEKFIFPSQSSLHFLEAGRLLPRSQQRATFPHNKAD